MRIIFDEKADDCIKFDQITEDHIIVSKFPTPCILCKKKHKIEGEFKRNWHWRVLDNSFTQANGYSGYSQGFNTLEEGLSSMKEHSIKIEVFNSFESAIQYVLEL